MTKNRQNILFYGLPCIYYKGKFLLFSPYKREILILNERELNGVTLAKDLLHQGYIRSPKNYKSDYDLELYFFITESCNMACKYCFGSYGNSNNKMSLKMAIDILKQIIKKDYKQIRVWFSGGEPTLDFELIKGVVSYLKKRKKIKTDFEISTNGIMSDNVLKFLIKNHFFVRISCDGLPNIQNKQRPLKNGQPSSKIVGSTIRRLANQDINHLIKMVVTHESLNNMFGSAKYLIGLGVKYLRIDYARIHGRAQNNYQNIDSDIFIDSFIKILDYVRNTDVRLASLAIGNLFEPYKSFCKVVTSNKIMISWDGNISKCIENVNNCNSDFCIGNFRKNKLQINNLKKNQLENLSVELMDDCRDCFAKYICSGGCFHRNNIANGNFLKPERYDCEFKKKMIQNLIIYFYQISK